MRQEPVQRCVVCLEQEDEKVAVPVLAQFSPTEPHHRPKLEAMTRNSNHQEPLEVHILCSHPDIIQLLRGMSQEMLGLMLCESQVGETSNSSPAVSPFPDAAILLPIATIP